MQDTFFWQGDLSYKILSCPHAEGEVLVGDDQGSGKRVKTEKEAN